MIKYDNKIIGEDNYNAIVTGLKNEYRFFGILKNSCTKHLSGNNVICIAYVYTNIDFNELKYTHICFKENLVDFFDFDNENFVLIHHMLFKSVNSKAEGLMIINDINGKHKISHEL